MGNHRGAIIVAWLIAVFCALTGPDNHTIYVSPKDVVTVFSEPGVGKAPTAVVTGNGTWFVQESVETVIARLRGATAAEKVNGDDK